MRFVASNSPSFHVDLPPGAWIFLSVESSPSVFVEVLSVDEQPHTFR
jgi:hypothetical protein